MNAAVIYYSKHHGNTFKLLEEINNKYDIALYDVCDNKNIDFSKYGIIGIASGIYNSSFSKKLIDFAANALPENKPVFLIYTCGVKNKKYTAEIEKCLKNKNVPVLGIYSSLGYDTNGFFKLFGGISKGHPDKEELKGALEFYEGIIKKFEK